MGPVSQFGLVHSKHGVTLCRMQTEPASFNVVSFQTAQDIIELLMGRGGPEIIRPGAAPLQKSQFHAKSFAFPQKSRLRAMVFHRRSLA